MLASKKKIRWSKDVQMYITSLSHSPAGFPQKTSKAKGLGQEGGHPATQQVFELKHFLKMTGNLKISLDSYALLED